MTGILIAARLGSTRLAQKHLIQAEGKSFLEWLMLRLLTQFKTEIEQEKVKIIIATADTEDNRRFEEIVKPYKVAVFYGNENNIPLRQLECATHFQLKHIINIDGDDILISPNAVSVVYSSLINGADFVKTTGLPLGLNVMGYSHELLKNALDKIEEKQLLETGWGRIFDGFEVQKHQLGNYDADEKLRFTLDYREDASFFTALINHFKNNIITVSDKILIEAVLEKKFYEINGELSKIYWQNYYSLIKKENI